MTDAGGRTDLHYAALNDDVSLAATLLEAGADPNASDKRGLRPLHMAAQSSSLAAATILLDHGAEVDAKDIHGNTPLWTAVFNFRGSDAVVRLLRARGSDPTSLNTSGRSPLSLARSIANYPVADLFADLP